MPAVDRTRPIPPAAKPPVAIPLGSIRAHRKTGGAVVTIERVGRTLHRHRVSLRRYARLRDWTITAAPRHWCTSGWWGRSSIAVSLWGAA